MGQCCRTCGKKILIVSEPNTGPKAKWGGLRKASRITVVHEHELSEQQTIVEKLNPATFRKWREVLENRCHWKQVA